MILKSNEMLIISFSSLRTTSFVHLMPSYAHKMSNAANIKEKKNIKARSANVFKHGHRDQQNSLYS